MPKLFWIFLSSVIPRWYFVFIAACLRICNARVRAECKGRIPIIGGGSNRVIFDYLLVVWLQRPIATIYFSNVCANSSAAGGFISITERSIAPSFFCCAGASFIFLSICNIDCRKYNSLFTRLFLSADRKHSQTL